MVSKDLLRVLLFLHVVASSVLFRGTQCQQISDDFDNPVVLPRVTQLVYAQISNMTSLLNNEIKSHSTFCVSDPDADWNKAFNFSSDLGFVSSCILKTKGDITQRLCTAAEIKFYLNSLLKRSSSANYLKPNKNCNLNSWVSGCEPGWACSVPKRQEVDLRNSQEIPARTTDCQACCEGFFCPHGITCMIRSSICIIHSKGEKSFCSSQKVSCNRETGCLLENLERKGEGSQGVFKVCKGFIEIVENLKWVA